VSARAFVLLAFAITAGACVIPYTGGADVGGASDGDASVDAGSDATADMNAEVAADANDDTTADADVVTTTDADHTSCGALGGICNPVAQDCTPAANCYVDYSASATTPHCGPPSSGTEGASCTTASSCRSGLSCVCPNGGNCGFIGGSVGTPTLQCARLCCDDTTCGAERCAQGVYAIPLGMSTLSPLGMCAAGCTLGDPGACSATQTCLAQNAGASGYRGICVNAVAANTVGMRCGPGFGTCAHGLICDVVAPSACRVPCDGSHPCTSGACQDPTGTGVRHCP
jgi:hypothetical protein